MLRKEILGTKIKTQSGLSKPITIAQPKDDSDYKSENFLDTDILLAKDIKQFVKGQEIDTSNFLKYKDRKGTAIYLDNKEYAINSYPLIPAYNADYSSHGDLRTCNFTIGSCTFQHKVGGSDQSISFLTDNNYKMQLSEYGWTYHIGFDFDDTKRNDQITIDNNGITMNTYDPTNIGLYITTSGGTNQLKLDSDGGSLIRGDRKLNFSSSALSFVKNNENQCFMNNDGEVGCECLKVYSYFSDDDPVPDHGMIIFDNNIQIISDKTLINFAKWNDEQNGTELYVDSIFPANNAVTHSPSISVYGNVGINHDGRNVSLGRNGIELTVDSQPISFLSIGEPNEDNYTETTVTADNLSARNGGLYITGNTKITGTLETTGRITANKGITINGGVVEYGQINVEGGIVRDGLGVGHIDKYQNKYLLCSDTAQQSSTKVYTTDGGIQETVLKSDYDALVARVAALEAKLAQ